MGKTDSRHHAEHKCVLSVAAEMSTGGSGKVEGPVFAVGCQKWRVRLQCPSSLSTSSDYVSLLLVCAGGNTGRTRCRMCLVNHLEAERSVHAAAERDFTAEAQAILQLLDGLQGLLERLQLLR